MITKVYERENETQVSSNLCYYWLLDGRVVVYELTGVQRADIDLWKETCLNVMDNYQDIATYNEIQDFRQSDFTNYLQQTANQLSESYTHEIAGYVIVLPPKTMAGQLFKHILSKVIKTFNPKATWLIFSELEEAVSYLEHNLDQR